MDAVDKKIYTTRTMSFSASRAKIAFMFVVCIAFVAGGPPLIDGTVGASKGNTSVLLGWFSMIFFGLAAMVTAFNFVRANQRVLVTPTGITNTEICSYEIPWDNVKRIAIWKAPRGGSIGLMLHLRDCVLGRDGLNTVDRPNSANLSGRFYIQASGLNTNLNELSHTVKKFAQANCPAIEITY